VGKDVAMSAAEEKKVSHVIDIGEGSVEVYRADSPHPGQPKDGVFRTHIASVDELDGLDNPRLLRVYNHLKKGPPVRKLESHAKGVASVWRLLGNLIAVPAATPSLEAGNVKPRRAKISGEAVIEVLAKVNPKRPNTKAHAAFALYRTGMTVAEALKAGVSRADLSWDSRHKFITLRRT
jgi:hypothetical protein